LSRIDLCTHTTTKPTVKVLTFLDVFHGLICIDSNCPKSLRELIAQNEKWVSIPPKASPANTSEVFWRDTITRYQVKHPIVA